VARQHVAVNRGQLLVRHGVDRGVKVSQAAKEEAQGAAQLPVGFRHLLQDAGADLRLG
jgi:hypothetical protein